MGFIISKIKNILGRKPHQGPIIVPRKAHNLSRANISANALKVLYRLKQQGFEAYLVGGGVRDLLLGLHPKDFDVVTNATPDQVRSIFHNCRIIGRRFRLAHVVFGRDYVEVATFRKQAEVDDPNHMQSNDGMIMRDNAYGNMQEDAWRRDFTINALYYNIKDYSLVDYTGGLKDLEQRKLRMIGNVTQRYREDPVRMLRAIRFSAKLGLSLDKSLTQPLKQLKHLIHNIPQARLFDEVLKLLHSGAGVKAFHLLIQYELFELLFTKLAQPIQTDAVAKRFIECVLKSTDDRVNDHKPIQPAFVLAAMIWPKLCQDAAQMQKEGTPGFVAKTRACEMNLSIMLKSMSIPKRIVHAVREICQFQLRLERRDGKRAFALLNETRFRAAYDFLLLRAQAKEPVEELANWWTTFIDADNHTKKAMVQKVAKGSRKRKKKRKQPKKVNHE